MVPSIAFSKLLAQKRKSMGMTQERLAENAGISRNFVSCLENGLRQPTLTTLWNLATALKMRPSEMVAYIEQICKNGK